MIAVNNIESEEILARIPKLCVIEPKNSEIKDIVTKSNLIEIFCIINYLILRN